MLGAAGILVPELLTKVRSGLGLSIYRRLLAHAAPRRRRRRTRSRGPAAVLPGGRGGAAHLGGGWQGHLLHGPCDPLPHPGAQRAPPRSPALPRRCTRLTARLARGNAGHYVQLGGGAALEGHAQPGLRQRGAHARCALLRRPAPLILASADAPGLCATVAVRAGPDLQGQQGDGHRGWIPGRPLVRPLQLRRLPQGAWRGRSARGCTRTERCVRLRLHCKHQR